MAWYRHPGVLVGAALVAALLAALAGSLVTGSGEPGLRVDNDPDKVSEDNTLAGEPADGWAATTLPRIVWPFKRSDLVVFVADDVDADERVALAEGLAAHDAAGQVRELQAAEVADRVGETQAPRLRSQGAGGALLIEMRGGAQARQAAKRILPTHDSERLERASGSSEPPEHLYGDSRIAGTILPECRQLARSAALTGAHHAQALLDDTRCGDDYRVIAAGPRAEEPWVVTARARSGPPEGPGDTTEADPPGLEVPAAAEVACVEVFTVRAASGERCADEQGEGVQGLVGTRWDRKPPVLAGVAPADADRVIAAGETLALTDGPGDASVFGGALAPDDDAVAVRALDGQGRVLEERAVTPGDLFPLDRPVDMPGPRLARGRGPAFVLRSSSWAFDHAREALVVLDGSDQAAVEATRAELERDDAVVDVERIDQETLREALKKTSFARLPPADRIRSQVALRTTTTDHDTARWLATLAERHEIRTVHAPTCGELPATAVARGVDHANALLADAGCDDVTVLDAGDAPRRLAVALVTDEQACTYARLASTGRDRTCRPRRDDQPLQVHATHPGPRPSASTSGLRLAHGLAPAAADTVEVRAGAEEVSAEVVPVADGVSAFTALLEGEGVVGATARDAAGGVLAEADTGPPDGRIEPRPDPVPGEAPGGPDETAAPPTRCLSPSS